MFCVELRGQGPAQAQAVEDWRAHGAVWIVLQEDRVFAGQQGLDLLGQNQGDQGLHAKLSHRFRTQGLVQATGRGEEEALFSQRLPEQEADR
ncbi:hypothetical protein D3C80_1937730 [compost metagenome]